MYELYFDGGAEPNPGKAGAGAVIYLNDEELYSVSFYLGDNVTNNYAEYIGLLKGLELAIEHNIKNIIVKGDSQLVIKQINGEFKVNSECLLPIYTKIKILFNCFDNIDFIHVKRDKNKRADELANQGKNITQINDTDERPQQNTMKMLKPNNPDEKLCNSGKKWEPEEEKQLLEKLQSNICLDKIAEEHNRTVGGIKSRIRCIAFDMYEKKFPIEEIMKVTKLEYNEVTQTIKRRELQNSDKIKRKREKHAKKIHDLYISNKNTQDESQNYINSSLNSIDNISEFEKISNRLNMIESKLDKLFNILEKLELSE